MSFPVGWLQPPIFNTRMEAGASFKLAVWFHENQNNELAENIGRAPSN